MPEIMFTIHQPDSTSSTSSLDPTSHTKPVNKTHSSTQMSVGARMRKIKVCSARLITACSLYIHATNLQTAQFCTFESESGGHTTDSPLAFSLMLYKLSCSPAVYHWATHAHQTNSFILFHAISSESSQPANTPLGSRENQFGPHKPKKTELYSSQAPQTATHQTKHSVYT